MQLNRENILTLKNNLSDVLERVSDYDDLKKFIASLEDSLSDSVARVRLLESKNLELRKIIETQDLELTRMGIRPFREVPPLEKDLKNKGEL